MESKNIVFICKDTCFCEYALNILESACNKKNIMVIKPKSKNDLNIINNCNNIDYIISFLSPFKIDVTILKKAKIAAINFHPGPPNYPGIGCYNFALYEESKEYGVTCHHMDSNLDSGAIIMTSYFPILSNDNVDSLKLKSMIHLLYLFEKIVAIISKNGELPESEEIWARKAFTRKELNDLCNINIDSMSNQEIKKRIKATYIDGMPQFGPKILYNGHKFVLSLQGEDND